MSSSTDGAPAAAAVQPQAKRKSRKLVWSTGGSLSTTKKRDLPSVTNGLSTPTREEPLNAEILLIRKNTTATRATDTFSESISVASAAPTISSSSTSSSSSPPPPPSSPSRGHGRSRSFFFRKAARSVTSKAGLAEHGQREGGPDAWAGKEALEKSEVERGAFKLASCRARTLEEISDLVCRKAEEELRPQPHPGTHSSFFAITKVEEEARLSKNTVQASLAHQILLPCSLSSPTRRKVNSLWSEGRNGAREATTTLDSSTLDGLLHSSSRPAPLPPKRPSRNSVSSPRPRSRSIATASAAKSHFHTRPRQHSRSGSSGSSSTSSSARIWISQPDGRSEATSTSLASSFGSQVETFVKSESAQSFGSLRAVTERRAASHSRPGSSSASISSFVTAASEQQGTSRSRSGSACSNSSAGGGACGPRIIDDPPPLPPWLHKGIVSEEKWQRSTRQPFNTPTFGKDSFEPIRRREGGGDSSASSCCSVSHFGSLSLDYVEERIRTARGEKETGLGISPFASTSMEDLID